MMAVATFAAGCFWGVEAAFRKMDGVMSTEVGYIGGHVANPTYEQVCGHGTGHAEAVRVVFDADEVSYDKLLDLFWGMHDPTQMNRQGADIGDQYRTAIFYHDEAQKQAAEASREKLTEAGVFGAPIVTEIVAAGDFWRAEDYHQQYLAKRGVVHSL
jgi:peptide-methionine (S)-S-oxide reductase